MVRINGHLEGRVRPTTFSIVGWASTIRGTLALQTLGNWLNFASSLVGFIAGALGFIVGLLLILLHFAFKQLYDASSTPTIAGAEEGDLLAVGLMIAILSVLGVAGAGMVQSSKNKDSMATSGQEEYWWLLIIPEFIHDFAGHHPILGTMLMFASGVGMYVGLGIMVTPSLTQGFVWILPAMIIAGSVLALCSVLLHRET